MEDIIVKIDTAKLGIPRRGDTGHIRARPGRVVFPSGESLVLLHSGKAAETFEKSWAGGCISVNNYRTITYFLSQQYCCDMMIEAEWEDLRRKNSPCYICIFCAH